MRQKRIDFFCCCRRLETNFQHFFSSGEEWLVMVTMELKITLLIMHNGKSQNEIKCGKKSKKGCERNIFSKIIIQ